MRRAIFWAVIAVIVIAVGAVGYGAGAGLFHPCGPADTLIRLVNARSSSASTERCRKC
ncbi:MAG: hypothetical protein AB7U48_02400 [Bauldia sp.]